MDLSTIRVRSFIIGLIVLGVVILLISFGVTRLYQSVTKSGTVQETATNKIVTASPKPSGQALGQQTKATPTPATQSAAKPNVTTQPAAGSETQEVKNPGITIENIQAGSKLNSPLSVNGRANVTGKVILEVKDQNGKTLSSTQVDGCLGTDACPFQANLSFEKPITETGTLIVYNRTADGQQLYRKSIPVNFN